MGIEEEILQITYEVKGLEQGQALEAQLDRIRDARGRFVAAEKAAAAADDQAEAATRKLERATYELADSYEVLGVEQSGVFTSAQKVGPALAAVAAAQDKIGSTPLGAGLDRTADGLEKVSKSGTKAKGGMAGFGQSALQTGRVVQDFVQGGFGGILNNIEGFTQSIGLGAGAAGALTILGTVAFLATPKIKEFIASFGGTAEAVDRVEALKQRVKELEDNPGRVAVDTRELDLAKEKLDKLAKAQAEFNAQHDNQNAGEAASGKAVEEAIDESATGAEGVANKVKTGLIRGATAASIPLREAKDRQDDGDAKLREAHDRRKRAVTDSDFAAADALEAQANAQIADAQEAARKARLAIEKDAESTYGQMLLDAKKGHGAAQEAARKRLAEQLRAVGEEGIAIGVEAADPRQMQADAQFIERQKDQAQLAKALKTKREADEKKALKDVRGFLDDEFDRDIDELKGGGKADRAGGKAADRAALQAAKAQEDEVKAGAGKVDATVGPTLQRRFEQLMAHNAALNEQGGGIDPAELERRLRLETFAMLRKSVGPEAAQRATSGIIDKGNEDLQRRMAQLSGAQGTNQAKLISIAGALAGEMEHAVGVQVRHGLMIGEVARKVEAMQRTGRVRGQGSGR